MLTSPDKMPNPIKEFFDKKKAQAKFKVAGPGQKLGDAASAERDSAREVAFPGIWADSALAGKFEVVASF